MNVRKIALEAIEKIITKNAFSNIVVNEYLNKFEFSPEDKALFTKLTYGTVQNMITIDYYLHPFIGHKKQKSWVKHLLYMSCYQLVYLDIPEYAVLNEAVEIANTKDRAIGSFVNAVLRNFLRHDLRSLEGLDEIETLSVKHSHPSWLVSFLLKDYNYDTVEKILRENMTVRDEGIRINTLKASNEEVYKTLDQEGIPYQASELVQNGFSTNHNLTKHPLFTKGKITVQDLSAQLVSEVVDPKEAQLVLDLAAAPGGKSSHLAALMNNQGRIDACDIFPHKIKLMENGFKRLGVKCVKTQIIDARRLQDVVMEETYDHILADMPCSGLGVLSHKVDLKYQINIKAIDEIIKLQAEILESTWKLVKRGGFYTYSTCTINKEENEEQIKTFLENHPDFEIVYEKVILPFEHHSDGFYICKMRRN